MLERLAELRKSKNWSLQETADYLGIAKSTYAGYESGYREPSLKAISQLADLFDTTVDFILNRVEYKNKYIEITELLNTNEQQLYLDGQSLTREELYEFIAFIQTKRKLESFPE